MDSLMRLFSELLADASSWCGTSTTRDLETAARRVKHEGLSFLTISLPSFARDFESCLELGRCDPSLFRGFHKQGALPRFLGGLLDLVFDRQSGSLLATPSIDSIFFIRQLSLVFKKIELDCTQVRINQAYDAYIQCEKELRTHGKTSLFKKSRREFKFFSEAMWASRLCHIDYDVYHRNLMPKHGSGAVAERISGNRKYDIVEWNRRLDDSFPVDLFAVSNASWSEQIGNIQFLEPGSERPVRVITVPKTMKTPRIIAIEPLCMQYTQQSLLELLVPQLTSLTCGSLNFKSQERNRELALLGSRSGYFATLDLSEASDRVHSALVWDMLANAPNLRRAVFACRSTRADVPNHGVIPLVKFASMGSALCFPMEAMVFLTITLMGYCKAKGLSPSEGVIRRFFEEVCIYGDDIIIPVDTVPYVSRELETFGLRVNKHKSFSTGKFRESCGLDAYDGVPVKPVYMRRLFPANRRDVSSRVSAVSLANHLYFSGCWRAARYVRSQAGAHPFVASTSGLLGYQSYIPLRDVGRYNPNLHTWETKGDVISVVAPNSPSSDHGALLKFFLKRGDLPFHDVKHLERHGRPDCVRTKIRWATPF